MEKTTHYIIYQKHDVSDGIVLDGYKCAKKGNKQDMAQFYRELYAKAKKLVEMGEATDLKEFYDKDGTLWFRFTRNGQVMRTFICDRKRAQSLTA